MKAKAPGGSVYSVLKRGSGFSELWNVCVYHKDFHRIIITSKLILIITSLLTYIVMSHQLMVSAGNENLICEVVDCTETTPTS